jgi:hypothetical protein
LSATLTRNPNPDTAANDGAPDAGESRPQADTPVNIGAALDNEELLQRFTDWYKASKDHFHEWRQEAMACYDFTAGHQWSEEDKKVLTDQNRPAVTFNRVGPFVDGVSGLEIGNRQTTQYYPRQVGKAGVNELLTGAATWARQECDAEDEESEALRDVIICGVGCTQTRMDYTDDPDGMPVIDRVDPLELYPDPSSRKPNYDEARFVMRAKDVPVAAAEEMFPDFPPQDLHARWAEDDADDSRQPHNARLAPYYRVDQSGEIDRERQQCRLIEVEWWDYVTAYRVLDNQTGRFVRLSAEDAATYRARAALLGRRPVMLKDRTRRYYKAICGNIVLKVLRGPDEGGFSYKFMTGKRDRNSGTWYGIVRAMIDPQKWANKFFTQALHIVNVNAKGGIFAETDAFVDIDEARDGMADADTIVELNPGGLGKIKDKAPPPFPMQINQMMESALSAIPATAGINLEMIAQQSAQQAGVLEMQRKQQGMTVLAYIFDAKRRYQKQQGRLMLWMLTTFVSDGRLIRIGGSDDAQYVPFVHEPGVAEYDVVVDDAPTSPNMKERVWGMIMQMMPMLRSLPLPPQAMVELMKYSPFPASLIQKFSEFAQQPPQAPPHVQAKMQADQAAAQAKTMTAQAQAQRSQAEAAHRAAETARLSVETQLLPLRAKSDLDEQSARIENLKAQAINSLQDAGISADDARFGQFKSALDALLAATAQAHDQSMDLAQHALAVNQAMNPPQPTGQAA